MFRGSPKTIAWLALYLGSHHIGFHWEVLEGRSLQWHLADSLLGIRGGHGVESGRKCYKFVDCASRW